MSSFHGPVETFLLFLLKTIQFLLNVVAEAVK